MIHVSKILIIGAGSAGSVVIKKCLQHPSIFTEVHVASRSIDKLEKLKMSLDNDIQIHSCDADDTQQLKPEDDWNKNQNSIKRKNKK